MTIMTVGIDLAKNVSSLHGIDEAGKVALRRTVRRDQLLELIATLPACVIAMEACSGAHHWARQFAVLGHTPKLIAPKFVTPYRMRGRHGKNDAADAAAICEADAHVEVTAQADERARRLMGTPGIGPVSASALVAAVGNAPDFKNGAAVGCVAWIGAQTVQQRWQVPIGQHHEGGRFLCVIRLKHQAHGRHAHGGIGLKICLTTFRRQSVSYLRTFSINRKPVLINRQIRQRW